VAVLLLTREADMFRGFEPDNEAEAWRYINDPNIRSPFFRSVLAESSFLNFETLHQSISTDKNLQVLIWKVVAGKTSFAKSLFGLVESYN
jgi:hypothetical protein